MNAAMEWVIDTCVLETANKPLDPLCLDAIKILALIKDAHILVMDIEGDILKEYEPYMPWESLARQWLVRMMSSNKIQFYSNKLPKRYVTQLVSELKFDLDDIKFVGLAFQSNDKVIVSKDSDYNENVTEYLKNNLDVSIYEIVECAKIL